MARYDFLAIPVVDETGRLVGIVTHDDVIDVVVEEATEDAHRMGGVAPIEGDYLETPLGSVWFKRFIWLSCLFVTGMLTFSVMSHFEGLIGKFAVLSLFLPLLLATGGNSGSQAATLITRAMALGQIHPHTWWRVLRHEFLVGIALGVSLGLLGFLQSLVIGEEALGEVNRWSLALVIAVTVSVICLWGTLVGSMLPLLFKWLGFDPALASSPFVATLCDVTGITIYFTIASMALGF
jgi:magnesium transporter